MQSNTRFYYILEANLWTIFNSYYGKSNLKISDIRRLEAISLVQDYGIVIVRYAF